MNLKILAPILILLGAVAGWFSHQYYVQRQASESLLNEAAAPPIAPLPAITLPDLNGRAVSLSQFKGKVLVVNLWASWCPPCRMETPGFIKMQREFGSKNVQFVGIGIDDEAPLRKFAAEMGINYPVLLSGGQADHVVSALGDDESALPYTLLVDREGMIRERHIGYFSEAKLRQSIASLL